MIEHINFAKEMQVPYPIKVENGDIVRLYPGDSPKVFDKAPSGRLFLDGKISVEEDARSIKERLNVANNGYIEITIIITSNGAIYKKPILNFKGLPIYENEDFKYGLEEELQKTSKTFSLNNKKQEENLIDALKLTCRKYSKEKTGKKPITNINLVRI
jgi:ribonuclease J